MKVGILGAMIEEVQHIEQLMEVTDRKEIGSRQYIEGTISGIEVVLTFSRWGKVASSITTTTLINTFKVDFVLFSGVAGAVDPSLNIGDIVIGSGLYQHDMDASPIFDKFQIPLTDKKVFEPNIGDISKIEHASSVFLSNINAKINPEILSKYSIFSPKIKKGLIASGDRFVSDASTCENLKFQYKEDITLAVEMEGAAVAQVCFDFQIPFIIIRTISDKADHSAVIDFQSFISEVASHYSCEIVNNLFSN